MTDALAILQKYWKHNEFRSPQESIISSILSGKDTFALMPTGGGKSICFQVPALMSEGVCVVISPLVALMKDQVQNLENIGIKAIALTGGISEQEIIRILDNCEFGHYKFLYLSPERLQADWILNRIKSLPINLVAIDEAHCVSQWGHDFRPAYLKISLLKHYLPKVSFIALTASATKKVLDDVILQLGLADPAIFRKSFARENISYMVFEVEDKLYRIEQILRKNPEPSIIYVRNRKSCFDTAAQLQALGFKSTYYHGGLTNIEKLKNMRLWMNEEAQVIVSTTAFGMGIDKSNVKTVIHIELPESMESYYQEAGRAGRNEKKAFAILLSNRTDVLKAQNQFIAILPDKKTLLYVYIKLCNYLRIAYGEGIDQKFSFNLNHFCQKYNLKVVTTFSAIQFLDRQGILSLAQEYSEKIMIQFKIDSKEVIRFMRLNPADEPIIVNLLRTYAGIHDSQIAINVSLIAKKTSLQESDVLLTLEKLAQLDILHLNRNKSDATILFNEIRDDERTINRISKYLEAQNQQKAAKFEAVLHYVNEKTLCKSRIISTYFGEKTTVDCGICSTCLSKKNKVKNDTAHVAKILQLLNSKDLNSREIEKLANIKTDDVTFALQKLLENSQIIIKSDNKYSIKN
jgi:ATP-dependent DNA helicase RecQ